MNSINMGYAEVVRDTDAALLVWIEDLNEECWVPRSQLQSGDLDAPGDTGDLIVSAWIAEQKGWL